MTTGLYLGRPAVVRIVANELGIVKREIKVSVELVGPNNFIDVRIPHPLGGQQSTSK